MWHHGYDFIVRYVDNCEVALILLITILLMGAVVAHSALYLWAEKYEEKLEALRQKKLKKLIDEWVDAWNK